MEILRWQDVPTDELLAVKPDFDERNASERIREIHRYDDEAWVIDLEKQLCEGRNRSTATAAGGIGHSHQRPGVR